MRAASVCERCDDELCELSIFTVFPETVSRNRVPKPQVNYVGKGADLYKAGYKLHGSAYVINKHLGTTWLWDRVRVSGGAYGGFSDFDPHSGQARARARPKLLAARP